MKGLVRSLFTVSMIAGILGLGSLYARAQDPPTQQLYGVLEIVPGIRLTPDFGNFRLYIDGPPLAYPGRNALENLIRPDGTFSIKFRSARGASSLFVMRGVSSGEWTEAQIMTRAYYWIPEAEKYPNPAYPFFPSIGTSLAQRNAQAYIEAHGGVRTLSFPINIGLDLGTIVLTKPGSVTGRITLIGSPLPDMSSVVIAIPQFGLVTKPNPDGGYLLTGVPPGTWNVRLMGPGLTESPRTTQQASVVALNPTVGVDFVIRGSIPPEALQINPSNVPGVILEKEKQNLKQDAKEPAKPSEKAPEVKKPEEVDKTKSTIKDMLDKLPKKP